VWRNNNDRGGEDGDEEDTKRVDCWSQRSKQEFKKKAKLKSVTTVGASPEVCKRKGLRLVRHLDVEDKRGIRDAA